MHLIAVLIPVVLLLAVGWLLRLAGILTAPGRQALGALVFWVCLPALLLVKLSSRDPSQFFPAKAVLIGWLVFTVGFVGAMLAVRRLPPREQGSVVSGIGRFNGAFVGLPVLLMLVAPLPSGEADRIIASYLVLLACMAPLTQTLGLWAILAPLHRGGPEGLRRIARGLVINPLIASCLLGLGLALIAPGCLASGPVGASLDLLGQGAVPVALLCAGASIDFALLRRRRALLATVAALRLLAFPALGFATALLAGCAPDETVQLVILLACPTAASSVAIVGELGGDTGLMAGCVVATTVLAPLTLLGWLALLPALQ